MASATDRQPCVIDLAERPRMPAGSAIRVTAAWEDLPRVGRGYLLEHEARRLQVPEGFFREAVARGDRFGRGVWVLAEDPSPRGLLDMLEGLRAHEAEYVFTYDQAGDGRVAMMAASLGVPVRLAFAEDWAPAVLRSLLDYYLHCPVLEVPIEPFHSLSSAMAGEPGTLWDFFDEGIGRCFYVDGQERVSLSARWATRGEFFGTIDTPWRQMRATPLWRRVAGLRREVFLSQTACAFCRHWSCCAGFWRTAVQGEALCGLWTELMDALAAAYAVRDEAGGSHDAEHPDYDLL